MSFYRLVLTVAIAILSPAIQAAEVCTSRVIAAPISDVWLKIRDFGSHGDWIKGSPKVCLEGGSGTTIGVKSYTRFSNGETYVEVLTALDDKDYILKYDVIGDLPLPIYNASGTFRLYPIARVNSTVIERCLYYDTDLSREDREAFAKKRAQLLGSSLDLLADMFVR